MSRIGSSSSQAATMTERPSHGSGSYESVILGYENIELIGKGSFGSIRKVRRIEDGKVFARKELSYDRMTERDRKQIVAEVNILRLLSHKNIVSYEERFADKESNVLYIVMGFCGGGDLGALIKRTRRNNQLLPEATVWSYFAQLVSALDACHSGVRTSPSSSRIPILHRDIKPENVFLDDEDNIKLGDFGLSKQLGGAHAFASTYVGTPYYMSPELATGSSYDIKSDIWALGCVIFELCALSPPFDATSQAELTIKIKAGQVPSLPRGYSRELSNTIRSMLELSPRARPTTKQLLELAQIRVSLEAIELCDLRKKLTQRGAALDEREESLRERESQLNRLMAHQNFSSEHANSHLESRQAELEAAEQQMRAREAQLEHQQTLLEQADAELKTLKAELEATISREVERRMDTLASSRSAAAGSSARRMARSSGVTREAGSSRSVVPTPKTSPARLVPRPVAVRPTMMRRSSDRADVSIESVGSRSRNTRLAHLSARPSASGSATASRQGEAAISHSLLPATKEPSRRRSNGSDEWIDTPAESANASGSDSLDQGQDTSLGALPSTIPIESSPAPKAWSKYRSQSRANLAAFSSSLDKPRSSPLPKGALLARRLLEREGGCNPAADKSDMTMKDASMDKENESMSCVSFSVGQVKPLLGALAAKRARRITLEQKRQEEEAEEAADQASTAQAGKAEFPVETVEAAVYDVSNDPDLPSPFLRKGSKDVLLKGALSRPVLGINRNKAASSSKPSFAQETAIKAAKHAEAAAASMPPRVALDEFGAKTSVAPPAVDGSLRRKSHHQLSTAPTRPLLSTTLSSRETARDGQHRDRMLRKATSSSSMRPPRTSASAATAAASTALLNREPLPSHSMGFGGPRRSHAGVQ